MKIGILASPLIKLSSIFFFDYHQLMENFSQSHNLYLVGSMLNTPNYAQAGLPLPLLLSRKNFSRFGLLGYLRRCKSIKLASHNLGTLAYLRRMLEAKFDNKIVNLSANFFDRNNIDVLYSFPFYPEFYPVYVANLLKKPLLLEFWEDQICFNYEADLSEGVPRNIAIKERNRGYSWLKEITSLADHIIVPSSVLKNRLTTLGVEGKRVSIIPVCTHSFSPKDPSYVRSLHKLGNQKIVYYLGSMSPWHDLKCTIMALSKLRYKNSVLILSGGAERTFKSFSKYMKGVSNRVIYTGKLSPDEVDYYISAADVCVAPYNLTYPSGFFPGAVVRYMLGGKAIVATDLPEIREMFKGLKAGLLVRQNKVDEMADAIDFLLENPDESRKMGKVAKNIAENNYLWHHHTEKLEKVLSHITTPI
jgi:glycosyltransferase involved in cell wall biosynthesis